MKNLLIIFICLLMVSEGFSQGEIFHTSERDSLILDVSPEYRDPRTEERSKLFTKENAVRFTEEREQYRLTRLFKWYAHEYQLDFKDWPDSRLIITFLAGQDHKVDYCFFEARKMTFTGNGVEDESVLLSEKNEEQVIKVLRKMISETTPLMDVNYPYRFVMNLKPKDLFERNVDKKYINTLEEAQANTRPDTVIYINFSGLMLKEVPSVIYRFKNLKGLDLSKNYLTEFRAKPGKLKKLGAINLSENELGDKSLKFARYRKMAMIKLMNNRFTMIPEGIKVGRNLEYAWFAYNPMTNFGKSKFRQIRRAKDINLYHCQIPVLPPGIKKLKYVETLDIYHNQLKFIPKEIGKLKRLNTLAVSNNQLWKFPDEIVRLGNLKKLYAHHNKLDRLPELPAGLKVLDVGYNDFKDYPIRTRQLPELEEFDFSFNKVDEVPEGLLSLPKLKSVFMRTNEFSDDSSKSGKLNLLIKELESKQVTTKR